MTMEDKMITYIKMLLYQYRLLKLTSLNDKVEYLLYHNVDIYDLSILNTYITTYEPDVYKSISFLKNILNEDIDNTYIPYIKRYDDKQITIIKWFTKDGYIIDTPTDTLREWLTTVKLLNNIYLLGKDNVASGKLYVNTNILKSYIIYIDNIVTTITDDILIKNWRK